MSALIVLLIGGTGIYWKFKGLERSLVIRYSLAQALVVKGEYEPAIQIYRDISENNPESSLAAKALYSRAEILNLYQGQYYDSVLIYLQVEKDYPQSEEATLATRQAARVLKNRLQDYSRAVTVYQGILDGNPADGDQIRYELADSYFRISKYDQARIEFDELVKGWPQSPLVPEALYRAGVILALDGNFEEAEQVFRKVIKTYPDNTFSTEARFGLAASLEEQEKLQAALDILNKLEGVYSNGEVLQKKRDQVKERIRKKGKAI